MPEAATRYGPYELTALLGRGGMGEVWRARDTRLEREVAVKVSAQQFSDRFQREARTIAALNHPNICTLFDVGPDFLVMELVEGPTLAERIAQGPMTVEEALPLALQIAAALEAAHEKGIVHRDLKPDNIKLTAAGSLKVLDFGLAKALSEDGASVSDAAVTLSTPPTLAGAILGTPAYMAPEQARGHAADRRADIWAFGVVLFEMLTGERPFRGDTVSDILASVLRHEPDAAAIPAAVRPVLMRCLRKDRHQRWQAIGDVRLLLAEAPDDAIAASPAVPPPPRRRWLAIGLVAAGSALVAAATVWLLRPGATHPVANLIVPLASGQTLSEVSGGLAISPDGATIAYTVVADAERSLFLYRLDQGVSAQVETSAHAVAPFFSPDGNSVGFSAARSLFTVRTAGGTPKLICKCNGRAAWGADGFIYFDGGDKIARVPETGGTPQVLAGPDGRWPQVLPDGRGLLYVAGAVNGSFGDNASIMALSPLDAPPRALLNGGTAPHLLASGHLVFAHNGSIFAAPVNPRSLELTGPAVEVVRGVEQGPGGMAAFALAANGTLAYVDGGESASGSRYVPVWLDADGREQPVAITPRWLLEPAVSPDGSRVAFAAAQAGNSREIWVLDLGRGSFSRISFSQPGDIPTHPAWTPDGQRIIYQVYGNQQQRLLSHAADGLGADQTLLTTTTEVIGSWTFMPGGQSLIVDLGRDPARLVTVSLSGDRTPKPLLVTAFNLVTPAVSPDGRWLAYASDESGRFEVFVQALAGPPRRLQVSNGGGRQPRWSRDGRKLYYTINGQMIEVDVVPSKPGAAQALAAGAPRPLFQFTGFSSSLLNGDIFARDYDIAPDGRFLALKPAADTGTTHQIHVILNWASTLTPR